MNLKNLEKVQGGDRARFVARVADATGEENHEFAIAGPESLIIDMFGDAEFELAIDGQGPKGGWETEFESVRNQERKLAWEAAGLESLDELAKKPPPFPERDNAVFAAVRRIEGEGTPFFFSFTTFSVKGGAHVFFAGSWVRTCSGAVTPTSGDQDLFLHLLWPFGPIVSASMKGGIFTDLVSYAVAKELPQFFPWYHIFGWSTGVCGTFTVFGS